MFAFSSCNVARVLCAFVVVTAVLDFCNALSVDAFIGGAFVSIIASDWSVDASFDDVAPVSGACILVIANNRSVLASQSWIASVNSASVVVIASSDIMSASVSFARVDGASIVIITSRNVFANSVNAFVGGAIVLVVTSDWSVDASLDEIASIGGAFVSVTAESCGWFVHASEVSIARINSASEVIVAVLWSEDASLDNITRCS